MGIPNSKSKVKFEEFMATITAADDGKDVGGPRDICSVQSTDSPDPMLVCRDGQRTNHLARLAGMYIRMGYRIEDVITLTLDWNSRNDPPLEIKKILSTCYSILASHQRNHGNDNTLIEVTPLFDIASAGVAYFLDHEPPKRRWLLNDCLPAGKVGMVVAKGGTGKSHLMLQLAISIATGEHLAGKWEIGEVGTVLALFAEDDQDEIHRRLFNCANAMAPTVTNAVDFYKNLKDKLFIKSMVAENNLMTNAVRDGDVVQTDYIQRLILAVKDVPNLKLIIIDPASRFRGGDENSAQDATRFVEALEAVVKATGAAVLVVHHMGKGASNSNEQTQDASRGSSAFTDGVRWQMNLAKLTPGEAKEYAIQDEERDFYLTATVTKNNYAPPQPKVILKRNNGGHLHKVELTSTKVQKATDTLSKVVELVRAESKRGALYSKSGFIDKFGGQDGELTMGRVSLRPILAEVLKTNKLEIHNGKLALPGRTVPKAKIKHSIENTPS